MIQMVKGMMARSKSRLVIRKIRRVFCPKDLSKE